MIVIEVQPNQDGEKRWAILELQGSVHNIDGTPLNGLELGNLSFVNNKPVLSIGNHLCEGSIVKLRNPLAIMRKQSDEANTKYLIQAVIYEKYLFSTRPRPVLK